jgi:hypothetical protein
MTTRLRIAAAIALVVAAVAVGLAASSAAQAAPRDNIANARLCLRGGWQTLQTSSGRQFRGLGHCIVYALFGRQFASSGPGGSETGGTGGGGTEGTGGTGTGGSGSGDGGE